MPISTKPYINTGNLIYDGRQPAFYDNNEISRFATLLEENSAVFTREWERLKNRKPKKKFFLLHSEKGWNTIMLHSYGMRYHKNCRHFKETLSLINSLPGVVTVYFSTLAPNTKITPHYGDTDATYRIQLGINIPEGLPNCGIEINGTPVGWQTGKVFAFNEAYYHVAWNLTDKPRTILIVDVIKPEHLTKKWYLLPAILGAMGVGRVLYALRLSKLPNAIVKVLHWGATAIFMVFLPLQQSLRVFYRN